MSKHVSAIEPVRSLDFIISFVLKFSGSRSVCQSDSWRLCCVQDEWEDRNSVSSSLVLPPPHPHIGASSLFFA